MTQQKPHFKKTKVFFHSCHSRQFSGFGKNSKNILKYLHSTGKYEIVEYANAYKQNDETLKTLPWKCIGSGPSDPVEIAKNNADPELGRKMSYGLLKIDEAIKAEKPDVYIGAEDIWALMEVTNKEWWNKIPCMIWTTLDSLPLFPESINLGKQIKHYFTWASFASDALRDKGVDHAECLHGAVETKNFFRLNNQEKKQLRTNHGLTNEFIIGFVFRNQLRKSVPNLIEGFNEFKNYTKNKTNAKLLLHTGWHEGWDIPSLVLEHGIDFNDILTTYICSKCKKYSIKPFSSTKSDCPHCKSKGSQSTINVRVSPTESQLNEIYNLMDVYCHPFTSGGQEIPIQEAKLTELITLSTNYSCGTDMCTKDSGGFPLEWSQFREPTTQFIKASTKPESIFKMLKKVFLMGQQEKEKLGKQARNFVINNYSTDVVGKQLESIIDSMELTNYDFKFDSRKLNINYTPDESLDDLNWITDIYKNMLGVYQTNHDKDAQHWYERLSNGESRESIFNKLKNICSTEISKKTNNEKINSFLSQSEISPIGIKASDNEYHVLLATQLIESIKQEDDYNKREIIFFTNHHLSSIINNNKSIKEIAKPIDKLNDAAYISENFHVFIDLDSLINSSPNRIINKTKNQYEIN